MSSKGQTFLPDFAASMVVFAVVIAMFLFAWNSVTNTGNSGVNNEVRREAVYTTTFLISTPGYPSDWNNSTVEIPGFASPDHVLQPEKLEEFRNISYSGQKSLLQAPRFYLSFSNESGEMVLNGENLTYGQEPVNASTIIVVNRNVLIDYPSGRKTAEMKYLVWRK